MKKILVLIGIFVVFFLAINFASFTSSFSYPVSPSAKITLRSGASDLRISSNDQKSMVTGFFKANLLNKVGFLNKDNHLEINSNTIKGELTLPNDIRFSTISLILGASNLDLNLKRSNIEQMYISSGASNIRLTVPGNSTSNIKLALGAGDLDIIIPTENKLDGMKIITQPLSDLSLGELWVKVADGFETKDFATAKITSTIDMRNVGSIKLNIGGEK